VTRAKALAAHVNAQVIQAASGALIAQQVAAGVRAGTASPDQGWMRFVEIAAQDGWKSASARSFIRELTKQTAAAGGRR
jgi:hypothetical protein